MGAEAVPILLNSADASLLRRRIRSVWLSMFVMVIGLIFLHPSSKLEGEGKLRVYFVGPIAIVSFIASCVYIVALVAAYAQLSVLLFRQALWLLLLSIYLFPVIGLTIVGYRCIISSETREVGSE